MDKEILLHIGFHKTGSTWLQHCLFGARTSELEVRLLPPTKSITSNEDLAHAILGVPFAWSECKENEWADILALYRKNLLVLASRQDNRPILLTSEEFCRLDSYNSLAVNSRLETLFEGFSVRVIAVKRNPLDFLQSRYSHEVAIGSETRDLDRFIREECHTSQFERRLLPWKTFEFVTEVVEIDYVKGVDSVDLVQEKIGPIFVGGVPPVISGVMYDAARNSFR